MINIERPFGIKIIILWILLCFLFNIIYFSLIIFGSSKGGVNVIEIILLSISLLLSLLVVQGLWRMKKWGWWLFFIVTISSWMGTVIYLSVEYKKMYGVGISISGFVVGAMLIYVLKKNIMNKFCIKKIKRKKLLFAPYIVFVCSIFYLGMEIFDTIIAIIISIVIVFSIYNINKKNF